MNETSASEILRVVNDMTASFQGTMTDGERATLNARHANDPESAACAAGSREEAMIEFTADALLTLAQDMQSVLDGRRESAYREALDVYYAAEELARQPEHAHLTVHVEAMRRAHESEYGHPPPRRTIDAATPERR